MLGRHGLGPSYLLGVNYWPPETGPFMWRRWNPQQVERDFARMHELGFNACRTFLLWPDFMPTPDRVEPSMLERLDHLLGLAERYDVGVLLTLFVGHMSGENWDVPWREGRDFWSDPWLVAQQRAYVSTLARRYRNARSLLAWVLTNEINHFAGVPSPTVGRAWVETMVATIRDEDPYHPIGLGDGAFSATGERTGLSLDQLRDLVDFVGPHLYFGDSDALRHSYRPAFTVALADAGLPVLVEEFGCSTAQASPSHQADYYRTTLHSTCLAGAVGALAWCWADFDLPHQRPYCHHPFEMRFGITTSWGETKPAGREMARFGRLLRRLAGGHYRLRSTGTYVLAPSYRHEGRYPFSNPDTRAIHGVLLEAYVLAQQAHLAPRVWSEPVLPLETDDVAPDAATLPPDARLVVAPHCQALTAPTWQALQRFASQGGTVYLSYHVDAWLPDLDRFIGAEPQTRYGLADVPDGPVTLVGVDVGQVPASLPALRYRPVADSRRNAYCPLSPGRATVLAVDHEGRPAVVWRRIGAGNVVFNAYPVEYYLWTSKNVHETDETWRLYKAVARLAGIQPHLHGADPWVQAAWLDGPEDAVLWLVNHAWEPRSVSLPPDGVDVETDERVEGPLVLDAKATRVLRFPTRGSDGGTERPWEG